MTAEKWSDDPKTDAGPIISSRVRLARNLRKYRFAPRLSPEAARAMIRDVAGAVRDAALPGGARLRMIDPRDLTESVRAALLEGHAVSPEFLSGGAYSPKALLLSDDESVGIMINEEDHIRMQAVTPGDDVDGAYAIADGVDDVIERGVEYAFEPDFGYLTACPTNAGTGMRASFMAHLPGLALTGQAANVLQSAAKFGITARGIYGEGTKPVGHIFQISNQVTTGKSEGAIIALLRNVTAEVTGREKAARKALFSGTNLADRIWRSYGILAYARRLGAEEAMEHLSDIRLGFEEGILNIARPKRPIYNLMINAQPGRVRARASGETTDAETDVSRAEFLRSML